MAGQSKPFGEKESNDDVRKAFHGTAFSTSPRPAPRSDYPPR